MKQGKSPVVKIIVNQEETQSTSGHEESWRNKWGPSHKAKYDHVTDRV